MKKIISFVIRKIPRKYLQLISPLALKILGLFYRGNKVECPVCNSHFRAFVPYGRGESARNNALCPNCQALERHRLIWVYLQQKTDFFQKPQKVLHIAPESCFIHRFEKLKNLDYITADIESPLAKVKMDIHQIPFADNTFEVAFCNHVMEHVADDIKAMSEIRRVLKPGGWAIIQVPFFNNDLEITLEDKSIISPEERFKAYGQEDHVRMYGRDYGRRLEKAGFQVKEDDFVMQLDKKIVEKFALPAQEIIYLAQKSA
jgi:SAM-dependent methyltransferase